MSYVYLCFIHQCESMRKSSQLHAQLTATQHSSPRLAVSHLLSSADKGWQNMARESSRWIPNDPNKGEDGEESQSVEKSWKGIQLVLAMLAMLAMLAHETTRDQESKVSCLIQSSLMCRTPSTVSFQALSSPAKVEPIVANSQVFAAFTTSFCMGNVKGKEWTWPSSAGLDCSCFLFFGRFHRCLLKSLLSIHNQ